MEKFNQIKIDYCINARAAGFEQQRRVGGRCCSKAAAQYKDMAGFVGNVKGAACVLESRHTKWHTNERYLYLCRTINSAF